MAGHARAYSIVALFLAACAGNLPFEPTLTCLEPELDIHEWQKISSRFGVFSLTLPPGSVELDVQCFDSACGRIEAGSWTLGYDMGTLAGPGDSARVPFNAVLADRCTFELEQRTLDVAVFRWLADTIRVHPSMAGKIGAAAATPLTPEIGLHFFVTTESEDALDEFLQAMTTTIIDFDP